MSDRDTDVDAAAFRTEARVIGYLPSHSDKAVEATLNAVPAVRLIRLEGPDAVRRHAGQLDGLITGGGKASYSAEVAAILRHGAPRLRWIQVTTAGYDALDQFGVPEGATLTGTGGGFDRPVAEHAMALLLAIAHNLPGASDPTLRPRWDRDRLAPTLGLDGRCLLIVGLGGIGREVASRARAFGMSVIGITRSARPDAAADEVFAASRLMDVLPRADAIVLCAPLTEETRHLMNADRLSACREGALLVNVGRGGLVDTPALVDALASGRIAGAGLDVTEPEPLPEDHPLWRMPNVVITPHVAPAGSLVAVDTIARHIHDNAVRFVAGRPLAGCFTLG